MFALAMQTAACNGHHHLKQRLAQWILIAHDRWENDELPLTHEFLSLMLCVHRSSVSNLAADLQREGMIRHSRGKVTVLSRADLEKRACDCYGAVRDRYNELLSV
jgi:CRP-like cAMP-binding protein